MVRATFRTRAILFLLVLAGILYTGRLIKYVLIPMSIFVQRDQSLRNTNISRQNILLFVGIYSAPIRIDRRKDVRETWMTQCKISKKAVCWFITDGQDMRGKPLEDRARLILENESRLHGDLLFAQSPAGYNFARRYLWTAQWAYERFNFQYLLRVDDDYFICFEKLLLELEFHRPKQKFAWGWLHCRRPGIVLIDEGFHIASNDLVKSFLSRVNTTLLCHPYGDQALALWIKDIPGVQLFGDNKRIFQIFYPKDYLKLENRNEICQTFLAIHRCYFHKMKYYWNIYQKEKDTISYIVPPIVFPCHLPPSVNTSRFQGILFAVPTPCKDNPIWQRGQYYKGYEGYIIDSFRKQDLVS